jgi:nitrite reductase/ring-hydroxylating ferredoxin subunit
MAVYLAYLLVVLHVAYGEMQLEVRPILPLVLVAAAFGVTALHLVAAARARAPERAAALVVEADGARWINAGPPDAVPEGRARPVCPPDGERIALICHEGKLSAVAAVCAHQGGPLDEGRVIDGCLTCPWHGWQYRPADGQSPPPFEERLATHPVRLVDGRVLVRLEPLPPGTPTEPVVVPRKEGPRG